MKRLAFTMLELVVVLIAIGIIAVIAIPNLNSNPLDEAAEQVANHIRYTQHLAMVDDKYDVNDPNWYTEKWQIRFRRNSGSSGYVIFSDLNHQRNVDAGEAAIDPMTGTPIDGFNQYTLADLTRKYDIRGDNAGIVQSCFTNDGSLVTSNRGVFAFDHLGRPYSGLSNAVNPTQYLMNVDCDLTLTNNTGEQITIRVFRETGYVCILDSAGNACR